jgi:hypothetical protein
LIDDVGGDVSCGDFFKQCWHCAKG